MWYKEQRFQDQNATKETFFAPQCKVFAAIDENILQSLQVCVLNCVVYVLRYYFSSFSA